MTAKPGLRPKLSTYTIAARLARCSGLRAMAAVHDHGPARLSSNVCSFELQSPNPGPDRPRIGRLSFQDRVPIETPHYVAVSSRGAVPHLSQDMMRGNTRINAMYAALEDCE